MSEESELIEKLKSRVNDQGRTINKMAKVMNSRKDQITKLNNDVYILKSKMIGIERMLKGLEKINSADDVLSDMFKGKFG